jgi:4-aminobutyrate aminotransferase / (S)-3-amino-2-methylpropionate transaminase / 5-aminovalerate transaminase
MSFSEIPPPPEEEPGQDAPFIRTRPPGPQSRSWLTRAGRTSVPMGPKRPPPGPRGVRTDIPAGTIVYASAKGSNVLDVDGNRYVDLAGGFGAMLIGHSHPNLLRILEFQSQRLLQALGDVFPSEAKIALMDRLVELHPRGDAQVILGQSGADAVSAALKTAALYTGRSGVLAFEGAYHGLSYGPLAACGLRASYREPFLGQLNPHVEFIAYPRDPSLASLSLERAERMLRSGAIGAVLFEPILGRGGCVVPPDEFLPELARRARAAGALVVADEIWTGLGRGGRMFHSQRGDFFPDLVCLGKGLGGGVPISALIGDSRIMGSWAREHEVVETSTFAGAPLACACAIATLDVISREQLPARAADVGERWHAELSAELSAVPAVEVRGAGLMVGIDLGERPGAAGKLQQALLRRGYITSTGGGQREVLVLTPPLNTAGGLLGAFVPELGAEVRALLGAGSR